MTQSTIQVDAAGLRATAATALNEAADLQGVSAAPAVDAGGGFLWVAAVQAVHTSAAATGALQAGLFTAIAHATLLAATAFGASDNQNANTIQGVI
jgi:hypothetical protein